MPVVVLARLATLSCNLVFRILKLEIGGDVAEPLQSICSYRPQEGSPTHAKTQAGILRSHDNLHTSVQIAKRRGNGCQAHVHFPNIAHISHIFISPRCVWEHHGNAIVSLDYRLT
jgi:hypothetical protein